MTDPQLTSADAEKRLLLIQRAQEIGSVSKACREFGVSRDTFYRWRKRLREGGEEELFANRRRIPHPKRRTSSAIEQAILEATRESPHWGRRKIALLLKKKGLIVSESGIRGVWIRNDLLSQHQRATHHQEHLVTEGKTSTPEQRLYLRRASIRHRVERVLQKDTSFATGTLDYFNLQLKADKQGPFLYLYQDTHRPLACATLSSSLDPHSAMTFIADKVMPILKKNRLTLCLLLMSRKEAMNLKRAAVGKIQSFQQPFEILRLSKNENPWKNSMREFRRHLVQGLPRKKPPHKEVLGRQVEQRINGLLRQWIQRKKKGR